MDGEFGGFTVNGGWLVFLALAALWVALAIESRSRRLSALLEAALKEAEQLRAESAGAGPNADAARLGPELEQLAAQNWRDNIARNACIPGGTVEGNEGKFQWVIHSEWGDIPELLRVSVEVRWTERGNPYHYVLESLYAVE